MHVIRHFPPLADFKPKPTILTIGSYDGLHQGHKAIIQKVKETAEHHQLASALVTFYPHPKAIVAPQLNLAYLTTVEEKLAILAHLGVDTVAILPFDKTLAETSAFQFIKQIVTFFQPFQIWAGSDFKFGQAQSGNITYLEELGSEMDFQVQVMPTQTHNDLKISSTQVRQVLTSGEVNKAITLLGHYPFLQGTVVKGEQRGRTIGFPTANIALPADKLLPANGVYAVLIRIAENIYPAVANVGLRPTFNGQHRSVEVYIFNFGADIYHQTVRVSLVSYLRGEQKFSDIEALIKQIKIDVDQAQQILNTNANFDLMI